MTVDSSGLRKQVADYAREVVRVAGEEIARATEEDYGMPERTGALRQSRHLEYSDDGRTFTCDFGYDAEYASYMDEGTRPHEIRGNPLLAFDWPAAGRFMVLPIVHHPGTIAYDFFGKRLPDAWPDALEVAAGKVSG